MSISERIIEIRKINDLSQVEFAKMLNLSKQTVSNYETGIRQPGLDIILKISDTFNVTTDYLLGRTGYKNYISEELSSSGTFYKDTVYKICQWDTEWDDIDIQLFNALFGSKEFLDLIKNMIKYGRAPFKLLIKLQDFAESTIPGYERILELDKVRNVFLKPDVDKALSEALKMLAVYFDENIEDGEQRKDD